MTGNRSEKARMLMECREAIQEVHPEARLREACYLAGEVFESGIPYESKKRLVVAAFDQWKTAGIPAAEVRAMVAMAAEGLGLIAEDASSGRFDDAVSLEVELFDIAAGRGKYSGMDAESRNRAAEEAVGKSGCPGFPGATAGNFGGFDPDGPAASMAA